MVLIKEYRTVLPLTVAEYQKGHHWVVNTEINSGKKNVVVLERKPYKDEETGIQGEYVKRKSGNDPNTPTIIRKLAPSGSLEMFEEIWETYPATKIVITNGYMKEKLKVTFRSTVLPDPGTSESPHKIPSDQNVETVFNDFLKTSEKNPAHDPTQFYSNKTGRGKLSSTWVTDALNKNGDRQPDGSCFGETPVMCIYTLLEVEFNVFGLQSTMEKTLHSQLYQSLIAHQRAIFCTIDSWHDLTLTEIHAMIQDKKQGDGKSKNSNIVDDIEKIQITN